MYEIEPKKDFLIGIDSDGCVFDTMGAKQRVHFHPLIIQHWGLQKIERQLREAAEFFNLYSAWRGPNRFIALLKTFEALPDMPGVAESGTKLPATAALRAYVNSGLPLGNPTLKSECQRTGDPELLRVLEWSLDVNRDIAENMDEVPPFEGVRECLDLMHPKADLIVVSQTPEEALVNEWRLHRIIGKVQVIAGQELGTKAEHLAMAKGDRYPGDRILMLGDAPGDRKAAEAVGACFFPILPGRELESWKRLHDEGFARFLDGRFKGAYEDALKAEFATMLPDTPPWSR